MDLVIVYNKPDEHYPMEYLDINNRDVLLLNDEDYINRFFDNLLDCFKYYKYYNKFILNNKLHRHI